MTAGKLYVREVPGARGHVMVGISTAHLGKLERVEDRAFDAMMHAASHAERSRFEHLVDRWKRLHAAVHAARGSWARMWGLS